MSKIQFKTPQGIAMFPWINKADTQFDAAGQYKVNLRLSSEAGKALVAKVKEVANDAFGDKAKAAKLPFKKDDETGDMIIVTKSKFQPKVVDSAGTTIPPHRLPAIYGGSELVLGGTMYPYNTGGNIGVSFQLGGVQIVKLSSSANGTDMSFEPIEDGFVASNDNDEDGDGGDYNF
jgi:hypothetical protein